MIIGAGYMIWVTLTLAFLVTISVILYIVCPVNNINTWDQVFVVLLKYRSNNINTNGNKKQNSQILVTSMGIFQEQELWCSIVEVVYGYSGLTSGYISGLTKGVMIWCHSRYYVVYILPGFSFIPLGCIPTHNNQTNFLTDENLREAN